MALLQQNFGKSGTPCKLSDYVSNEVEIMDAFSNVEIVSTPLAPGLLNSQQSKKLSPRTKISAYHLHRDLKSPIPNMRVLALQSIKSPLKNVFTQPDVPRPMRKSRDAADDVNNGLPSIEEVMRNIVVYVEVRTGEDNRSGGVKKVIAALGARVSNSLCRTTTHVVFKDGLMSTYKKAKSMNIPIVSILWIEACKLQRKICDPANFPISNLDRYENPELYEKMKRYKNMQPGSECNKRVRVKKQLKDSTFKSTPKGETLKSSQTDITRYFTQSNKNLQPINSTETPTRTPVSKAPVDSPATVLLNRMSSGAYTPLNKTKQREKPVSSEATPLNTRQNSIDKNITVATNSIAKMSICNMKDRMETEAQTPHRTVVTKRQSFMSRRTLAPMNFRQIEEDTKGKDRVKELPKENSNDSKIQTGEVSSARRTTFAIRPMDIANSAGETPSTSEQAKKTMRRRTLFTPQRILESPRINISAMMNSTKRRTLYTSQKMIETPTNADAVTATPPNNTETKDDFMDCLSIDTPTAIPQNRRRRTLFDISMDIISHQVKHLNTKTQLCLTPSNAEEINDCPTNVGSENNNAAAIAGPAPAEIDVTAAEKQNISGDSTENVGESIRTAAAAAAAEKRKRKLFAPVETSPFTPPATPAPLAAVSLNGSSGNSTNGAMTIPRAAVKRRRTLLPKQSTVPILGAAPSTTQINTDEKLAPLKARRSTLDFETVKNIKSNATAKQEDTEQQQTEIALKENKIVTSKSKETIGDSSKPAARKRHPLLAFTNMHKEQVEVINEAVAKLRKFKLDRTVSAQTTHMVSLEARRTMNILRGLVRGLWILDYKWVTDSLSAGYWLPEEPYELKSFSRAVEICRAERQAFGSSYKCELFADLGAFFISPRCDNVPIRDLKELIRMCGGKVEEQRQNAKFILSNSTKAFDDKTYVTPLWILDSITQMQLMRIQKYSVCSELPTKQTVSNTRNMPTAIDMKDQHKYSMLDQINSNLKYSRKMRVDSDPSRIYSRTCTS